MGASMKITRNEKNEEKRFSPSVGKMCDAIKL
jgi:hypothetical protein